MFNNNNNGYLSYGQQFNPSNYPQAYPYYNNYIQQDINNINKQAFRPNNTFNLVNQNILQGKVVDSIDTIKAMEIPLDGSVTFFPLADGTAIVTKQLQSDGTSKIVTYKPFLDTPKNEEEKKEEVKEKEYMTIDEFEKRVVAFDTTDIIEDLKEVKEKLKEFSKELEKLKENKEVKAGKK